jgi:Holliday junction resolvase RusA-like endonuclease
MKIIIPGVPLSQIRMKFSARNGIARVYDPREKYKKDIRKLLKTQFSTRDFLSFPRLSFIFHMPIPSSFPKKIQKLYRSGHYKHIKKPDTDNLVKLYLDCLDNIAFEGDQKVTLGPCIKLYHPHPKTIVILNEMSQILSQTEIDRETWLFLFSQESEKCSWAEKDFPSDSCALDKLELLQFPDKTALDQKVDSLCPILLAQNLKELNCPVDMQSDCQNS